MSTPYCPQGCTALCNTCDDAGTIYDRHGVHAGACLGRHSAPTLATYDRICPTLAPHTWVHNSQPAPEQSVRTRIREAWRLIKLGFFA